MHATLLSEHDDTSRDDHIVVLRGATWADYQRVLEVRGDHSAPRIAYKQGLLQIMSPSNSHERIKSMLGRLVEVYCLERDVDFTTVGSWTIEDKAQDRGVEPDECFVFGPLGEETRPDLAIEVVWTSGGIDKLELYRAFGVREVWFWRRGRLSAFILRDAGYEESATSAALPGIALAEIASFVDHPSTSEAIRAYRAVLRSRG